MTTWRRRRSDTLVRTIEGDLGIDLHVRGDAKIGNLVRRRGFSSLPQLLDAYHGEATEHARTRRVFISYHYEDLRQIQGLRLMMHNPNVKVEIYERSVREAVNSDRGAYVRSRIRPMIEKAEVLLCCIGNGTASRDWVDWEVRAAHHARLGLCGVRLKGSRGKTPRALVELGAPVRTWSAENIVQLIEQAAARRS